MEDLKQKPDLINRRRETQWCDGDFYKIVHNDFGVAESQSKFLKAT